jgi:release factor glutamine methyltransferase
MPAINHWLETATQELKTAGIPSARLDAEIILAHTLRKPRTFLHAHSDDSLDPRQCEIADARLQLRIDRTPIAYIVGHKEFYGRQFKVTPSTLIPRPESEAIIHLLKKYSTTVADKKLVDVGTGSGCLGITAKLEIPEFTVTLTDISRHALHVAEMNAAYHKATVSLIHGDLLARYPFSADIILANLPYVDEAWERSPETNHEPPEALFASAGGLHLINRLLYETKTQLADNGLIIIEADPRQHETITETAKKVGLKLLEAEGFIQVFQKQ